MGGNSNIPKDSTNVNLPEVQKNLEKMRAGYKEIREAEKKKQVAKELQDAVANGKISKEEIENWKNKAKIELEKLKQEELEKLKELEKDFQNKLEKPPFKGLG